MSDDRKDLPPVGAPNFLAKVRESLSTYLGNRGNLLDRGITLRDLTDAGIVTLRPGFLAGGRSPIYGPGPSVQDAYEIDLTPPPTPTGFAVSAAISNIFLEHDAPLYLQGHGHARTLVYGATWMSGPLPTFSDAVQITEFTGAVFAHPSNPATTWHLWIKWVTADGVASISPAGGTNGLVTRTGEDVALLLEALDGALTASQLHANLGSRIDLIDGGVAQPALPYPLAQLAAQQDALNQSLRLDLDQAGSDLLQAIVTTSNTLQLVTDAGVYVEPGTGLVKIEGLEAANDHLNTVDITLDAHAASIALKASTAYVDGAIASAVLSPADLLLYDSLDARLGTAEVDIDALESAVTLKAANTELTATNVRMTTAEADIDALEGQIILKVESAEFDAVTGGLDSRVGTAEVTLSALGDTSAITGLVQQGNTRLRDDAANAHTLLLLLLNGDAADKKAGEALAYAREDLTAYADVGIAAEAAKRLLLAAAVDTNLASLDEEKVVRATADSAEATERLALAVLVANNGAAITAEQTARANADTAEAAARTTLAARVTTAEGGISTNAAAIVTEQSARADAVTAVASSVTTLSSTVASNTAAISTEAGTRATQTGELYAQYTVKLDANGKVSGYGLASTGPTGAGSVFEVRVDKFVIAAEAGGAAGFVPFQVLTVPTDIGGVVVPAGAYASKAFIQDLQVTNAKIGNLAVDDAKVANLGVSKLIAGSVSVGQYIQSTGYMAGSAGWHINGNGNAEFSGVIVRGTVYASAGWIGGNTIDASGMQSPGYVAGVTGWRLASDGSLTAASGSFKGSITGASGVFGGDVHGGQFTTGAYTGYAWPATGNYGSYLGPSGLLLGNFNNNKYCQITHDGNIYTPGFSVVNGVMSIGQVDVINTTNIVGGAVTIPAYVSNNASEITLSYTLTGEAGVSYNVFILVGLTQNTGSMSQYLSIDGVIQWAEAVAEGTILSKGVNVSMMPGTHSIRAHSDNTSNTGASIYVLATKR